jgi:hypothetical protein
MSNKPYEVELASMETKVQFYAALMLTAAVAMPWIANTPTAQQTRYSGLGLIVLLIIIVLVLSRPIAQIEQILGGTYKRSVVYRFRWLIVMASVIGLFTLSIRDRGNEGFVGTLDPIGYWVQQNEIANNTTCDYEFLLSRQSEDLRVTQNKFDQGIATRYELDAAKRDFERTIRSQDDCDKRLADRRSIIYFHLIRLRLPSTQPKQ